MEKLAKFTKKPTDRINGSILSKKFRNYMGTPKAQSGMQATSFGTAVQRFLC